MGERVRKAISAIHGNNEYIVGNSKEVMYETCGTTSDYAVGRANIDFAFTIELPQGGEFGFDIEPEKIVYVLDETLPGIHEFGIYIVEKYNTSVIN